MMPLFGWSTYGPEGLLTTCSWDYSTRTTANRVYYVLLLTTGFLLPVALVIVSYGWIFCSMRRQSNLVITSMARRSSNSVCILRQIHRQTEMRTVKTFVALFLVYMTAWTPYAIVTIVGQFGSKGAKAYFIYCLSYLNTRNNKIFQLCIHIHIIFHYFRYLDPLYDSHCGLFRQDGRPHRSFRLRIRSSQIQGFF